MNANQELTVLIRDLGMSERDARECLGLPGPRETFNAQASTLSVTNSTSKHNVQTAQSNTVSNTSAGESTTSSTTELERKLLEIIPDIPLPIVRKKLEENNNDMDKTVEDLLSWSVLSSEFKVVENVKLRKQAKKSRRRERQFEKLIDQRRNDIECYAELTGRDVDGAADMLFDRNLSLSRAFHDSPGSTRYYFEPVKNDSDDEPDERIRWDSSNTVDSYNEFLYWDLNRLEMERTLIQQRMESLQNKMSSYRKSKATSVLASDASAECYALKKRMASVNAAVRLKLADAQIDGTDVPEIDLHFCTVDEARIAVDQARSIYLRKPGQVLKIITGRGNHSDGGKAVLRPWLKKYLAQFPKLRVVECDGFVFVKS